MRSRSGSPMARRERSRSSRVGANMVLDLDVGHRSRPHRVRLHQTRWVRVLQETQLARTFVLGVFTRVVQMPYGCQQGASPEEGSATRAPQSSALNPAVGSLLPDIAEWAVQAPSRVAFRRGVVDRLRSALMLEAAAFASLPPSSGDETVAVWNTSAQRLVSLWSEEGPELLARLRPPARWLLCGPGERDWSATGRELMCCVLRVGKRSMSALSLSRSRPFSTEELRSLGQLQPVLQLGDERQVEFGETIGARLSPRERQIFEYLVRGFRNEDIARALGTSPATVRNQLVRLYRKTGVSTRSELVGLATSRLLTQAAGGER